MLMGGSLTPGGSPSPEMGIAGSVRSLASSPMTTEFVAEPIPFTEEELAAVHFDANGLVAAIAQDAQTRDVLMLAWMNADALRRTLETGRGWYWSRSRGELWCKGETSGDRQFVRAVAYDCDMDAVLLTIDQEGRGACHTGERSCFFRTFGSGAAPGSV